MGVIIRQGFKFSIVTYIGIGLGAFNILYLFPKFLRPDEIGVRELIVSISMMLGYFGQLAMNHLIARYFPYFQDEAKQHNGLLILGLGIATFGFLIISILFYVFTPEFTSVFATNAEMLVQFRNLILPLSLLIIINTLLELWCRLHLRIAQPAFFREIIVRVIITLLVILYGERVITFHEFIIGVVASYAANSVLLIWYSHSLGVLYLKVKYVRVPLGKGREMFWYAAWMLLGGLGVIINERIDGVMLAWLSGVNETGIYAISFFIATIIEMPKRGVSQIAGTLVAKHWKEQDFHSLEKIYKQSSLNQLLLGGFLFVGIWVNIDSLFALIPNGEIYIAGKYVVLFIGLARLIDMANGVNSEIILNSPYYKFNLLSIVFLGLLSFGTNYLMIPKFGIVGAAAGSTISILLFNVVKGVMIWHKMKIHPFEKRTGQIIVTLTISYLVTLFVPNFGENLVLISLTIVTKSTSVLVVMIIGILKFNLSDEITSLIENRFSFFNYKK